MTHPGKLLEEKLELFGMTRKELAVRTGFTEKHISTVINGERSISASFAKQLGQVFDVSAKEWILKQFEYDNNQLEIADKNSIDREEIKILKHLSAIEEYCIGINLIKEYPNKVDRVLQMRTFLGVNNLLVIPNISYSAAYRAEVNTNAKVDPYVLFAWQILCEKLTKDITVDENLNIELLKKNIYNIKDLMMLDINEAIEKMTSIFSECGIAFKVAKNFRGAPVQGFIKKKDNNKIILCLTIRRQRADSFWFTLFHEIAHVLNGDYNNHFVDFESKKTDIEQKADDFAADVLINPDKYKKFLSARETFDIDSIKKFALENNVKPYIVIGRLQNDNFLEWSDFNDYIDKYTWA